VALEATIMGNTALFCAFIEIEGACREGTYLVLWRETRTVISIRERWRERLSWCSPHQAEWVYLCNRVSAIAVGVEAASKPDRVTLLIDSKAWVVVAEVVVLEACSFVQVLTGES